MLPRPANSLLRSMQILSFEIDDYKVTSPRDNSKIGVYSWRPTLFLGTLVGYP
jgi:hypothetical protein